MKKYIIPLFICLCLIAYIIGYTTTTTTTNLELVKPSTDDETVVLVTTINDNMDLIDAAFDDPLAYGDDTIIKADFADEDWGDMSVSSNSVTIDASVLDKANFKDEDWGDGSFATNLFTIDEDVLDKANFKDEDWGDVSVSSNSVTIDAAVIDETNLNLTNIVYCNKYTNPDDAITAISTANKTLLVTETETCDTNFTVPANVTVKFERGGSFAISNGITVTFFNGQLDAGLWQIFAYTGTGTLAGTPNLIEGFPEWWGADPSDETDDTTAIQSAIDFIDNYGLIKLSTGTYRTNKPLVIGNNISMSGKGYKDTFIFKTTNTDGSGSNTAPNAETDSYVVDSIITITHPDSEYTYAIYLSDFELMGQTASHSTMAIYAPRLAKSYLERIQTRYCDYGYYTFNSWMLTISDFASNNCISVLKYANDGSGGGTGTSLLANKVYAKTAEIGFDIYGLKDSVFNSCYVETITTLGDTDKAFYFYVSYGITLNSCCTEGVAGDILKFESASVAVNGFYTYLTDGITGGTHAQIFMDNADVVFNACGFTVFGTPRDSYNIVLQNGSHATFIDTEKPSGGDGYISYSTGSTLKTIDSNGYQYVDSASSITLNPSTKLSAFAATTSAELAGVISDETGTGVLVFGTTPTLTTPNIGNATGSIDGNSATVTGFTPASGSLTLAGADAITLTTSAATDVTLPTTGTLMANLEEDTDPDLGGELDAGAHSIGFTQQTITYDVTETIVDWKLSNKATVTLTGNVGTFSFTNPTNPCNLLVKIVQDGTGSRVITAWDTDIEWAGGTIPTLTTAANSVDICTFYFDGTKYYGMAGLDFK